MIEILDKYQGLIGESLLALAIYWAIRKDIKHIHIQIGVLFKNVARLDGRIDTHLNK